jgi:hypothetical protein
MIEELSDLQITTCSECGHPAGCVHGDEFELAFPIKLEDVELLKCPKCGHVEPGIFFEALKDAVIFALITKRTRLAGAEVRALRTYMHLDEREFARKTEISWAQLAKIESGEMEITLRQNPLIRMLLLGRDSHLGEERLQRFKRGELPKVKVGSSRMQRGPEIIRGR